MPDIKHPANPLFLRDQDLRQAMELMYFAYRRFTEAADQILVDQALGRAHHRALYFIGRHPGMTVKDLLAVLQITKQSLARVLKTLIDTGLVESRMGQQDRRERRLSLSPAGKALETQVAQAQMRLLKETFLTAGPEAVAGFRTVMMGLVPREALERFA